MCLSVDFKLGVTFVSLVWKILGHHIKWSYCTSYLFAIKQSQSQGRTRSSNHPWLIAARLALGAGWGVLARSTAPTFATTGPHGHKTGPHPSGPQGKCLVLATASRPLADLIYNNSNRWHMRNHKMEISKKKRHNLFSIWNLNCSGRVHQMRPICLAHYHTLYLLYDLLYFRTGIMPSHHACW